MDLQAQEDKSIKKQEAEHIEKYIFNDGRTLNLKIYMTINQIFVTISKFASYLAAVWIFVLIFTIMADIVGRTFFQFPLVGVPEIVRNSLVSIAFLLLPWATINKTHIRSTIVVDRVSKNGALVINVIAYTIGMALFAAIVYVSWPAFVIAFQHGHFEGEGALRVPVWPARLAVVIGCFLAAWSCLHILLSILFFERQNNKVQGGVAQ